jgi:uncharacterized membrane protein YkgB
MATAATDINVTNRLVEISPLSATLGRFLDITGIGVLRYGLVGILLFFGSFKFSGTEAVGIQPLIANSPFMSWMYSIFSVQAVSNIIGTTELIFAVLIASRAFSATLSAIGSIGAIGMLLTTLSFLFTTPGTWTNVPDFPLPVTTGTGAFLIKDLFLLGAAIVTAGEALLNRYRH